jgi:hypothetical protein
VSAQIRRGGSNPQILKSTQNKSTNQQRTNQQINKEQINPSTEQLIC